MDRVVLQKVEELIKVDFKAVPDRQLKKYYNSLQETTNAKRARYFVEGVRQLPTPAQPYRGDPLVLLEEVMSFSEESVRSAAQICSNDTTLRFLALLYLGILAVKTPVAEIPDTWRFVTGKAKEGNAAVDMEFVENITKAIHKLSSEEAVAREVGKAIMVLAAREPSEVSVEKLMLHLNLNDSRVKAVYSSWAYPTMESAPSKEYTAVERLETVLSARPIERKCYVLCFDSEHRAVGLEEVESLAEPSGVLAVCDTFWESGIDVRTAIAFNTAVPDDTIVLLDMVRGRPEYEKLVSPKYLCFIRKGANIPSSVNTIIRSVDTLLHRV